MKKNITQIRKILLIISLSIIFCSFTKNKIKTTTGYIHVYGNEPFTYIGIETTDEKEYTISADKKLIEELWATQGKYIEISGYIVKAETIREPGMLKDGKIEVLDWKYVK